MVEVAYGMLYSITFLAILPLMVTTQVPIPWLENKTVSHVITPGTKVAESCPSLESVHQHILDQVVSVLSSTRYFSIDQCGAGVWYQLVSIDMSDEHSQCPNGWLEENAGRVRACGRGTVGAICRSAFLNSDRHGYTKICGRAIGYQYGSTDAFYVASRNEDVNEAYVDGLSITYGLPRQHIWTFASGLSETGVGPGLYADSNCPCSGYPGPTPQLYVGNNWYCESGNPNATTPDGGDLFTNDLLWDGEDCEGTCCSNGKTPPWFSVELPGPTNEDIEARICSDENSNTNEDIFIKVFEIYIQ